MCESRACDTCVRTVWEYPCVFGTLSTPCFLGGGMNVRAVGGRLSVFHSQSQLHALFLRSALHPRHPIAQVSHLLQEANFFVFALEMCV